MTVTDACQICGGNERLRTMEAACEPEAERTLTVCEACLDRRAAKRSDKRDDEGRRLADALTSRAHEHPQGRYAYLVDPDEVSLVRLQHGWLETHTASA